MRRGFVRAAAASAAVYVAVTAFFARDLLWQLDTLIAHDEGDPLFLAALLHWNATVPPLTERWWQLPIFDPTRDALAFSEHLLGLWPLSAPLHWITRDAVVTYNVVTLLTFPLCGVAMFALVHRLTRHGAAAFLAGLTFAFAPYRFAVLPHLQMLASFWAPLALLGLHAYIETGRRRWLLLYATAWLLQAATNSYMLVFFSVVVGAWVVWFVAARGRWAALAAIAASTLVAVLPLVPVLGTYVSVHALHGFTRDPGEVRAYSADLAAMLCASPLLTNWRWLQTACRPEGHLFPGVIAAAAGLGAVLLGAGRSRPENRFARTVTIASRVMVAAGLVFAAVACSVVVVGPWALTLGPLRASASSMAKPVMLATVSLLVGLVTSPGIREAAAKSSARGFYLVAAVVTWLLALGPIVTFMGQPRAIQGPFALLAILPGMAGLRVPARFWLLTTMCLAVLVGFVAASLLAGRRRSIVAGGTILAGTLILADGWIDRIPTAPVPRAVPDERALRNAAVLTLPMDTLRDIAAGFRGVTGGWRSVNGYSGHFPAHYPALLEAMREADADAIVPFVAREDLHVVLAEGERGVRDMLERQPGVVRTAAGSGEVQYMIPRRPAVSRTERIGSRLPVKTVSASCEAGYAMRAADGDARTSWACGAQQSGHEIVIDLGQTRSVAAVVQNMADDNNYPRRLLLQTAVDAASWETVWDGSVRGLLIAQALERPSPSPRVTVAFASRPARYVRLRQTAAGQTLPWSIAELEVWSGSD